MAEYSVGPAMESNDRAVAIGTRSNRMVLDLKPSIGR